MPQDYYKSNEESYEGIKNDENTKCEIPRPESIKKFKIQTDKYHKTDVKVSRTKYGIKR